jgi:hypothetical protein
MQAGAVREDECMKRCRSLSSPPLNAIQQPFNTGERDRIGREPQDLEIIRVLQPRAQFAHVIIREPSGAKPELL